LHQLLAEIRLSPGSPLLSRENPARIKQAGVKLKEAGYPVLVYVSENTAHEFLTWRRSLYQLAPILFKN
jgi:hypothetical protein